MPDLTDQLNAALGGRYVIRRELGRGGMATVFLAEDHRHGRPVAIKVLDPGLAAAVGPERFLREIQLTARLQHPHILPLLDSGEAAGLLYYVMPYVEGESLRERLAREKQLPVDQALRLAREVASALDYAHRHGAVHRDIKPENILLGDGQALVADFGIARAGASVAGVKLTTTGMLIGTPLYMSPEQGSGGAVDGRSDLYSLGCVVYEMLAGQPPFTGPTAESLAHQHLSVAPRPVTELRPAVPGEIARAIQRTLAKAAADRFSTAAEFAAAIATVTERAAAEQRPEGHERRGTGAMRQAESRGAKPTGRRARSIALAGVVVAMALGAVAAWQRWGPSSPAARHPAKKAWILVAEFDGPADDPALAVATRDLVSAALDQSSIVATVPRSELRVALQMAGKADTTRVNAAIAEELAYRSSVRTVAQGSIGRLGEGYSLVVRVLDVDRDSVVISVSDVARDGKALIPTVERVARRIRARLGERGSDVQATRQLLNVMTPSFEAYKKWRTGQQLLLRGDNRGALESCRAALTLDPDFAGAMTVMGFAFTNLGEIDSALAAFRESLRRPGRLSDRARLLAEAQVADLQGNVSLAVADLDRLVQQDPSYMAAHSNLGYVLYRSGQYEQALVSLERGAEASPFGPSQILLLNQFIAYLALGRLDEAHQVARNLRGDFRQSAPVWLATASGNWALAESLGTALESNPTASREMRRLGALAVGSAAATRGAFGSAERALRRAEQWVGATSTPAARVSEQAAPRARLLLALVSGSVVGPPGGEWTRDTTTSALVTRGLWAAAAEESTRARHLLETLRSRPAGELARAGAGPELLEASIAARNHRWDETVRILAPAARQGSEIGFQEDGGGRVTLRWVVADAYENLGRPDSAAAYMEMVLSPLGRVDQEYLARGIAFSFARRRLVMLYAKMGRIEDAKRHWQVFAQTVRTPDPEIQPLIAEARAALASAQGMAKSPRR